MPVTIPTNGSGGQQQIRHAVEEMQSGYTNSKLEAEVKHIIIVSSHFRSHFRPLFFAALSLATRYSDLVITIFVAESILSIVDEELDLFFGQTITYRKQSHHNGRGSSLNEKTGDDTSASNRVRVVGLRNDMEDSTRVAAADWQHEFQSVYRQLPSYLRSCWNNDCKEDDKEEESNKGNMLLQNSDKEQSSNGNKATNGHSQSSSIFETAPTMLVFDILMDIPKVVKNMASDLGQALPDFKMIGWAQNPVAWAIRRLTAPDIQQKLKLLDCDLGEESEPSDASSKHIEEVLMRTDGSIIEVQGSHRCYDYELVPQYGSMEIHARNLHIVYKAGRNLRLCDGVLFSNCPEFEPDAAAMLQKELDKPVFQIGAQFPLHWRPSTPTNQVDGHEQISSDQELTTIDSDLPVQDFLNHIYRTLGSQRVLYISFGSVYSMEKRPDLIELLMQMLFEVNSGPNGLQIPFIFTTFTTKDLIPPELRQQIEKAGVGIFCQFAPQHLILRHPATAWFLTHGGSSSVHESVYNSVPLVFWPATTDQPIGAAQLCLNHDCGIELIQVRTGPSIGQPTMRGVQHQGGSMATIQKELADMLELIVSQHKSGFDKVKQRASEIRLNVEKLALQMRESQGTGGSCTLAIEELYSIL